MIPFIPIVTAFWGRHSRQILIYGGIALAVIFALRWYGNQQYREGADDAKTGVLERLGAESEEQLKRQLDQLSGQQDEIDFAYRELADTRLQLDAERDRIETDRRQLISAHTRNLEAFRRSLANVSTDVSRIADSDLVAEWDHALADLRRFDSDTGDGLPPPGSAGTQDPPPGN